MGIRGFIRDLLLFYIGYRLLMAGAFRQEISDSTMILLGILAIFFAVWIMLERFGIMPRIGV